VHGEGIVKHGTILIGVVPYFYYRWRYRGRFPADEYPV
jgi:hypothetical protein